MFSTKYIERVISDTGDYLPIFGIDMFGLLPKSQRVVKAINDVILKIGNLKIETKSSDFIGKIFHSMIPSEIRKPLASYYTGNAPAKLLALIAIKKETDKVSDLACGSGTLLVESYHVLYDLYKTKYPDWTEEKIYKQIIEKQIYGNDITLFASHLAAMNLASQYLDGEITQINITATDGLQITPRHRYGTLLDFVKSTEISTISMDGIKRSIAYPFVDCVIMNPPFSRQTDMTDTILKNLKNISIEWFPSKNDRKNYIDKKMGLHGYFLIHADHLIKKNGKIAMILPSSTFTTDYTEKLLLFLQNKHYSIDYVIEILSKRSAFSEDVTFKEYMVIFQKGTLRTNSQTTMVSILNTFSLEEVNDIYNSIINEKKSEILILNVIKTQKLYDSSKWTELFTEKTDFTFFKSPKLEPYNGNTSQFRIISGYHATYSDYLMLPNKEWNIEELNATTHKLVHHTLPRNDIQRECLIPTSYLVPAIRRSKDANSFVTSPNCYVLNLTYQLPRELDEFRRKYIFWAEYQLEAKWEQDRKKGHKRVPIVKRATYKKNPKGQRIIDNVPWFSHAYNNKCSNTISKLFVLVKYQPSARRTLSIYADKISSVNHGMFFIKSKNDEMYTSWMASSLYLVSLYQHQQVIHKDYYKMAIKDFAKILFPKLSEFLVEDSEIITLTDEANDLIAKWKALVKLPDESVPFLPQQLGADLVIKSKKKKNPPPDQIIHYNPLPERVALDKAWLKALGVADDKIDESLEEIYVWLINYMKTR